MAGLLAAIALACSRAAALVLFRQSYSGSRCSGCSYVYVCGLYVLYVCGLYVLLCIYTAYLQIVLTVLW